MASIQINNLQPAGSDLFNDSESFLAELAHEDLNIVSGGWNFMTITNTTTITITPTISSDM